MKLKFCQDNFDRSVNKALRGSKSEIKILFGKHLLWSQLKITVAWISSRAGEMDRGREKETWDTIHSKFLFLKVLMGST